MFVHEHGMGSPDKCLREVGKCLDFGPSTIIPLLTVSSEESTREAEKAWVSSLTVGPKIRHRRVRKLEEKSRVKVIINSKCLLDEICIRDYDQKDQKNIGYDCYSTKGLLYHSVSKEEKMRKRNLTPILMIRAGSTISGKRLADQWRETEETAGSRLEAWDDLTGLSLDPKGGTCSTKART